MTEFKSAFDAAKKHARSVFPEESVGFVVNGEYIPVENTALSPEQHKAEGECGCRLCAFRISAADTARYLPSAQIVLHSHPNGPVFPSRQDMIGQIQTSVPWGIIALDEDRIGDPQIWGDQLPVRPLLGRTFVHGICDCYSLIRDTFRLGREALEISGITHQWPLDPILLADVPRDDAWWEGADDFYGVLPPSYGWKEISIHEARPGDVFLMSFGTSKKLNHAGVLVTSDLVMHHLPGRLSRREPSGAWARRAAKWLRYTGESVNA